jgi:hypothetical protein
VVTNHSWFATNAAAVRGLWTLVSTCRCRLVNRPAANAAARVGNRATHAPMC